MKDEHIHIAFAEDHETVRESLTHFLNLLGGISVDIEASNGIELLEKLNNTPELPEICIIDVQMPYMDGYLLLIELKKRWPDIKVLVLTAFDNEALIIRMIKAGANGYLLKSCKPSMIKDALQSIRSSGYYYSQHASSAVFRLVENNHVRTQQFSEAEIQFIKYSCIDLTYNEIAAKMNTTVRSIDSFRDRVSNKLNVNTRAGIIMFAIQSGLVPVEVNSSIANIIPKIKSSKQ
jgi:two-component system invasion response regulator UvrY